MYLSLDPQVINLPVVVQPAQLLVRKAGVGDGKNALEALVGRPHRVRSRV